MSRDRLGLLVHGRRSRAVAGTELDQDAPHVLVDRVGRDVEVLADFLVRHTLRDESKDL